MTVRYQFSETEAIRGILKIRRWNHPWEAVRGPIAAALTAFFVIFERVHHHEKYGNEIIVFGCAGAILAMMVAYLAARFQVRRAITRQVRSNPVFFTSPEELTFDEQGLGFASASLKQEFAWAIFKGRRQDENYFYFFAGAGGFFCIVPKRAFDDAGLMEFHRCSQIPSFLS